MHRIVIAAMFVLISASVAAAETTKLTLKDAVTMALDNNSRVKAAAFKARADEQGVRSARSRYLPALAFEETLTASNAPLSAFMMKLDEGRFNPADFANPDTINKPSARHDFKTALTVQQPLFIPSYSSLKAMADADARKGELDLERVRQDIAFQVLFTYLEVRKGAAYVTAAEKAVADARENLRLAGVRTVAGVGLRSDELRSRTHLSAMEQMLVSAHNNLTLARMRLAQLTGIPADKAFEVSEITEVFAVPPFSDDAVSAALAQRVDLKITSADLEKSDAALGLARSEFLPTVGAFASYQLNAKDAPFGADSDAWSAGISLKWQIFDGFRRYSEHSRALSSRSATREMHESVTQDVTYQVRESYLRREEAASHLNVSKNALLDAEETVRLLTKRYENSLATLVELLDAQTVLNRSRADVVDTEAGYVLAEGRVLCATGTFVKEIVK